NHRQGGGSQGEPTGLPRFFGAETVNHVVSVDALRVETEGRQQSFVALKIDNPIGDRLPPTIPFDALNHQAIVGCTVGAHQSPGMYRMDASVDRAGFGAVQIDELKNEFARRPSHAVRLL